MTHRRAPSQPSAGAVLRRGAKLRCPNCGIGHLHDEQAGLGQALKLLSGCAACGMPFASREGDLWFFYYVSNAAITGLWLILAALLFRTGILTYPSTWPVWTLLASALIVSLVASLRRRRGVAIAIDYLVDRSSRPNAVPMRSAGRSSGSGGRRATIRPHEREVAGL